MESGNRARRHAGRLHNVIQKNTRKAVRSRGPSAGSPCCGMVGQNTPCSRLKQYENIGEWDTLWKSVGDAQSEDGCYVLLMKNSREKVQENDEMKLSAAVSVPKGRARTVELRIDEKVKMSVALELNLEEGAMLGIMVRGVVRSGSRVELCIASTQNLAGTRLVCRGNLVCHDGGKLSLSTSGTVGEKAGGSFCRYDMKILQTGDTSEVSAEPLLEVLGKDVEVRHGCSVGRVPRGALTYMTSRGMTERDAEELYLKGFLG